MREEIDDEGRTEKKKEIQKWENKKIAIKNENQIENLKKEI